jgi:hypothetical protein
MYGLVNKAIEQMVCARFVLETWEIIKRTAGVSSAAFLSMESYPDDVTQRLMLLHYFSDRPGLAPMVVGLLEGLAEIFHTSIDIAQVAHRDAGDDHDRFALHFQHS